MFQEFFDNIFPCQCQLIKDWKIKIEIKILLKESNLPVGVN
jgi:hypothetical protein